MKSLAEYTRVYLVRNVYATTFYRYHGELESLAYNTEFLRTYPYARVAALPFAVSRRFRSKWSYDPRPGENDEYGQPRLPGEGFFVVPCRDGKFTMAQVLDVGPWLIDDPYWRKGERPRAETAFERGDIIHSPQQGRDIRVTNPAGVDFTPEVWVALGISEKVAYSGNYSARVDLAIIEAWEEA